DAGTPPELYVPLFQSPARDLTYVVRAGGEVDSLVDDIRAAARWIDPDQPIANVRTLEQALADSMARPRFNALLMALFAGTALVLAVVGVYGVISYSLAMRTREIGVRMALGARSSDVMKLMLRQGLALSLAGIVLGLAGAASLTRLLSGLLYQTAPNDPAVFGAVTAAVILAGFLACWVPARRASRVDPMAVLRQE
ncbi:MAG TPA: FtsX-like permease family protein, partial [Candidatus Polarisedimenticolia bacterium]|nr:FtsX-like permease family protein [Candidatus Polarisedimenticolia bacterium]